VKLLALATSWTSQRGAGATVASADAAPSIVIASTMIAITKHTGPRPSSVGLTRAWLALTRGRPVERGACLSLARELATDDWWKPSEIGHLLTPPTRLGFVVNFVRAVALVGQCFADHSLVLAHFDPAGFQGSGELLRSDLCSGLRLRGSGLRRWWRWRQVAGPRKRRRGRAGPIWRARWRALAGIAFAGEAGVIGNTAVDPSVVDILAFVGVGRYQWACRRKEDVFATGIAADQVDRRNLF